jgi:hypothetical protein
MREQLEKNESKKLKYSDFLNLDFDSFSEDAFVALDEVSKKIAESSLNAEDYFKEINSFFSEEGLNPS